MKPTILLLGLFAAASLPLPAAAPRTLLFVDDGDVLYRSGTHRVFHPPQRYAGNPVISDRQQPWEQEIAWMSIYRQPATGKYQLWYQAYAGDLAKDRTRRCVVGYAESADGLVFTKPDLGLFAFNGNAHNSIVLVANGGTHDRYGASVVVDEAESNPARRYKMAYYDFTRDDQGVERPGLAVAFSPDGIHWTKYPHGPLLRTYYGARGLAVPEEGVPGPIWALPMTMSDALDAIIDPVRKLYVIYGKMWIDGPDGTLGWKHGMGRIVSRDFIHWSQPQLVLTPDDDDPSYVEFHTAPVFFYNDRYFAMLQILRRAVGGGVIDIELALSRDGLEWKRPFRRELFLPRGGAGSFDGGSLFPCADPVILPDEIRFYYGAYSAGATDAALVIRKSGIGFARLPRDRFAGLQPDAVSDQPTLLHPLSGIGQVTLKPLRIGRGTTLTLNAAAAAGAIRVEILDERGYRVPGFTQEEAVPVQGDGLRLPVAWKSHSLSDLPRGRYLLRLHLDHAEVFALTLQTATAQPEEEPAVGLIR